MDAGTAAIIGTVVGGLIGFGGTWLSGWQQAKVAARERRADAYTQALIALQRERVIIQRIWPIIGPGAQPPPPLTDEAAFLAQALLWGHASSAMRRLLDRWVRLQGQFWALASELEERITDDARLAGSSMRGAASGRARGEIWQELGKARSELIGSADDQGVLGAIEAQVRKELGYDD